MAIYQGADTMKASRDQSLWDVLQGKERHDKMTKEQIGKRNLFGALSDIGESFLPPGLKQFVDIGSKQLEQRLFEMPEYEEDPGFWTSSEVAKIKEQDETLRSGADVSILESVIGQFGDYLGTEEGAEAIEGFDLSSLFAREGGRVPKYKNGGEVNLGDILSALSAKGVTYRGGRSNKIEHTDSGGYETSGRYEVDTPEGVRFYEGKGSSDLGMQATMDKALLNALSTALESPSDSLVTQVPQYYGGGSVSKGSPTIAGYFSQQGKTLGGSNTQSLSQLLGRK